MLKQKPHNAIKLVHLVTTCTHCGEAVEIYITKDQLKRLLKELKKPPTEHMPVTPEGMKELKEGGYF